MKPCSNTFCAFNPQARHILPPAEPFDPHALMQVGKRVNASHQESICNGFTEPGGYPIIKNGFGGDKGFNPLQSGELPLN